jgi:hypothetical protein
VETRLKSTDAYVGDDEVEVVDVSNLTPLRNFSLEDFSVARIGYGTCRGIFEK